MFDHITISSCCVRSGSWFSFVASLVRVRLDGGVDESGFLEPNWSHGTKLGRFWDGHLGPLECVPATFVG